MIRRAIAAAVIALAAVVPGPADGTAVPVPAPLADERFVDWPTEVVLPVPPATPEPPRAARKPAAPRLYVTGVEGLASWMPSAYGSDYAALPAGPGWRFVVCGPGGCWEAVSNDAGPDRAMQREGRVIDLAVIRWEQVCGVHRKYGLCPVVVTILGRK